MNRYFCKDVQAADMHVKRCSLPLVTKERRIKTTTKMDVLWAATRWALCWLYLCSYWNSVTEDALPLKKITQWETSSYALRWLELKLFSLKKNNNKFGEDVWRNWNPHTFLVGMEKGSASVENSVVVLQKVKLRITPRPAIPLLGVHPEGLKTGTQANTCPQMSIEALFAVPRRWKQPKSPSTDKQAKQGSLLGSLPSSGVSYSIIQ